LRGLRITRVFGEYFFGPSDKRLHDAVFGFVVGDHLHFDFFGSTVGEDRSDFVDGVCGINFEHVIFERFAEIVIDAEFVRGGVGEIGA